MTGDFLQLGDTNYFGALYVVGNGHFGVLHTLMGPTTSAYKELRMTLDGATLTFERGDSLATITETTSFALASTIAGRTYHLRIGTGASDCHYSPGWFDWVRVTTTP